uniref:Uncharacterized protein n=1 Tax=Anopheles atroparvus TaxID=41427 RepID=A0A182IPU4_ANOAO
MEGSDTSDESTPSTGETSQPKDLAVGAQTMLNFTKNQPGENHYNDQRSPCGASSMLKMYSSKKTRDNNVWERNYNMAEVYAEKRKVLCEKISQEKAPTPFRAQPMPGFPVLKKKYHLPMFTLPCTPEVLKHGGKKVKPRRTDE